MNMEDNILWLIIYQTIDSVKDSGWFNDLALEEIENYPLATATLKKATLTDAGKKHLAEIKPQFETKE